MSYNNDENTTVLTQDVWKSKLKGLAKQLDDIQPGKSAQFNRKKKKRTKKHSFSNLAPYKTVPRSTKSTSSAVGGGGGMGGGTSNSIDNLRDQLIHQKQLVQLTKKRNIELSVHLNRQQGQMRKQDREMSKILKAKGNELQDIVVSDLKAEKLRNTLLKEKTTSLETQVFELKKQLKLIKDNRRTLQTQTQTIQQLERDNAFLRSKLSGDDTSDKNNEVVADLQLNLRQAQVQYEELSVQNRELHSKIDRLIRSERSLTKELDDTKAKENELNETTKALQNDIQIHEESYNKQARELTKLKKEQSILKEKASKCTYWHDSYKQIKLEVEVARDQLRDAKKEHEQEMSSLKQKFARQQSNDRQKLNNDMIEKHTEIQKEFTEKNVRLSKDLQQKQAETKKLKSKLENATRTCSELKQQVKNLESEKLEPQICRADVEMVEKREMKLKEDVKTLNNTIARLKAEMQAHSNDLANVTNLKHENENLKKSVNSLQVLVEQLQTRTKSETKQTNSDVYTPTTPILDDDDDDDNSNEDDPVSSTSSAKWQVVDEPSSSSSSSSPNSFQIIDGDNNNDENVDVVETQEQVTVEEKVEEPVNIEEESVKVEKEPVKVEKEEPVNIEDESSKVETQTQEPVNIEEEPVKVETQTQEPVNIEDKEAKATTSTPEDKPKNDVEKEIDNNRSVSELEFPDDALDSSIDDEYDDDFE